MSESRGGACPIDTGHATPPDYYERGVERHWVQRYWHRKRCTVLRQLVGEVNSVLLDIGCNGGFLTSKIAEQAGNADIVVLDLDRDSVAHACRSYSLAGLVADGCRLPFKNDSFDLITCLEVLEHVPEPGQIVEESFRCLKKGGRLIVLVPNSTLLFRLIWFFWTSTWGKAWQHKHVCEFNRRSLQDLLKRCGMRVEDVTTFHLGMLTAVKAVKA